LITCRPIRLTENWSWKWHSATSYGFLCAQECKFLVLVIRVPSQINWGDTDRNGHSADLSIPVSVVPQSSWKFCVYLYLGLALLPEHHLCHTVIVHVLHSLVGRNESSSKFCVHSQMFCDVAIAASIPPQQPYHFHCRNPIWNPRWHILHL
jgi:hypothetical protein